jgi:hypothetical protein
MDVDARIIELGVENQEKDGAMAFTAIRARLRLDP